MAQMDMKLAAPKTTSTNKYIKEKTKSCLSKTTSATAYVEKLFYQQGMLIGRHRIKFIIFPVLISLALCAGIVNMEIEYNIHKIFTPSSARSNDEFKVFTNFYNDGSGLFYFLLAVTAKDGGSLLRDEYRKNVIDFHDYFQHNYSIVSNGRDYTFEDLQINHKETNLIALTVLKAFNRTGVPLHFTYPVLEINSENYFMGDFFRKAKINHTTGLVMEVKNLFLGYFSAKGNKTHSELLDQWANSFWRQPKLNVYPNLEYYYFSDSFLTKELILNTLHIVPYMVVGFSLLTLFACFVSMSKDPVKCKPWETVASIFAVLLSSGSSFGIMFACGFKFVGTVAIVPILVLALGMDVTYITLRNWRRTSPSSPPAERLAEAMAESGPSIIITTLTNVISGLIGCIGTSYGVFVFCLTLSVAVTMLFFMQITFFAAVVELGGEREANRRNALFCCLKSSKSDEKPAQEIIVQHSQLNDWWSTVSALIAKILCTYICRITVCISLILYWITSVYCCTQMHFGMTAEKLLPPDSPVLDIIRLDKEDINAGRLLNIIVSQPPNLTIASEVHMLEQMVGEYEAIPECLGSNSTAFWLRSFQDYLSFTEEDNSGVDLERPLFDFLHSSSGSQWTNFVKFSLKKNHTDMLESFVIKVAYKRTYDWSVRTRYMTDFRKIADKYQQLDVTTWFDDNYNFVTDQLQSLTGNTIQDLIVTAVCMTFVCLLFIPNVFNTICAVLTIVSINVGVFGYLTAWDVPLDPVSMTSILLSVGYSVDFTSHISYHYYISPGENKEQKLCMALSSIGLPMLETGVSTLITVGCLCFVNYYIEWVFFKSIFLVIVLGLLHGLIVLPMFLAWIPLYCLTTMFMKTAPPTVATQSTNHDSAKSVVENNAPTHEISATKF